MSAPILLLATGGTIASTPNADGAVTSALKGRELLAPLPDEGGDVDVVDLAHGASWNFEPEFMAEVALQARAALVDGRASGVVVTHGTDTIEETLFLTDLLAGDATGHGPIVFTGAMRNAAERSADGPRNLEQALAVARSDAARGRGALLCVNDELHAARWVTKTDTSSVSTFRSPAAGPVGGVSGDGRARFWLDSPGRPSPAPSGIDAAVALVTAHGGMDGDIVGWHLERGAHGIVIEATGAGNVNQALLPGIERAVAAGVPVVVASRCLTGSVAPVYGGPGGGATLGALGVIAGGDLGAVRSRLALMVALAVDPAPARVAAWFGALLH
jgi:L-asparaginase